MDCKCSFFHLSHSFETILGGNENFEKKNILDMSVTHDKLSTWSYCKQLKPSMREENVVFVEPFLAI